MYKYNLNELTFLIPIRCESNDRTENIEIICNYINYYFETNIIIIESDKYQRLPEITKHCDLYIFSYSENDIFYRTKLNNELIRKCKTNYAILYDTDVIISPNQLASAYTRLREKKVYYCFPYDGRFIQVNSYLKKIFKQELDVEFLLLEPTLENEINTYNSFGGCFMFNVNEYIKCGMENEEIEGWGHDDAERIKRLTILGYDIYRINGPLFHLNHERGRNSYFFDKERRIKSYETYFHICSMSKNKLKQNIKLWEWTK